MTGNLEVPKDAVLNGKNYADWKMVVTWVLRQHGMDSIVFKGVRDSSDASAVSKGLTAQTFLTFSLNHEHRCKIQHCTDAHQIWIAITSIYENKSRRAVNTLWKRLFCFKIESINHVSQGISEMQTIVSDLRARQIQIDDSCLVGAIENALPQEFNEWLINWSMRETEPTLNELVSSINNFLETIKVNEIKNKAMVASAKPGSQSTSTSKKNCKYCKKDGHDISECRKLKKKKAEQDQQSSKQTSFAMMAVVSPSQNSDWLADSGSSLHLTNKLSWISNYRQLNIPISIRLGDDRIINAYGFGVVHTTIGTIHNVHYVPDIKTNLFSLSSAADQGIEITIKKDSMVLTKDNMTVISAKRQDKIYVMKFKVIPPAQPTCAAATLDEWHQRFGHISPETIKKMSKSEAVIGLDISNNPNQACEDCALNKCRNASHPTRTSSKASRPGTVLHADTVGPIKDLGFNGQKFILICKDEYSGFRMTSCINSKSQVAEELIKMIRQAELETGNNLLKLYTDNGSEYINDRLSTFLKEAGITHQTSANYTPQQNGFVEREVQTTTSTARTLLNSVKLPAKFWPEAVYTANYVLNRSLSANKTETPYELWHGVKPNVKNFRIFGQHAIIHKDRGYTKFDERGNKVIFVGYTNTHNTFRFFNPIKNQIDISCNVKFLSTSGPIILPTSKPNPEEQTTISVPIVDRSVQQVYANIPATVTPLRFSSTPRIVVNLPETNVPNESVYENNTSIMNQTLTSVNETTAPNNQATADTSMYESTYENTIQNNSEAVQEQIQEVQYENVDANQTGGTIRDATTSNHQVESPIYQDLEEASNTPNGQLLRRKLISHLLKEFIRIITKKRIRTTLHY